MVYDSVFNPIQEGQLRAIRSAVPSGVHPALVIQKSYQWMMRFVKAFMPWIQFNIDNKSPLDEPLIIERGVSRTRLAPFMFSETKA